MGCTNDTNETRPGGAPYGIHVSLPLSLLVAALILLTVFGNVLVVIAVFTSRALRAPQNLFLVSLASADILVATLVMPFSLANELMGYWYFGTVWCEIYLALDVLFCTASIAHLCAISLDRYWSITQAVRYNLKRTPRRIKRTVVVVWLIAAVISFPPLITMAKEGPGAEEGPACRINEERWYVICSSIGSFFLPCLIMVLVYLRIYQVAKRRTRAPPGDRRSEGGAAAATKGDRRENGVGRAAAAAAEEEEEEEKEEGGGDRPNGAGRAEPEAGAGGVAEGGGEEGELNGADMEESSSSDHKVNTPCSMKRRTSKGSKAKPGQAPPGQAPGRGPGRAPGRWKGRQNREKRFTFVLAVVIGVFVVCWFPFFFTYTLTALCQACCVPPTLFKFFFWFGYCNSALNPIIYTIFNNDFRRSFKKILCRRDRRLI